MRTMIDLPVAMRDGVRLSTDIFLPAGDGPFPVILWRTPYSNGDPSGHLRWRDAGYALVTQDCRGRFDSEGRFGPFREDEDGEDTVAWLLAQPWCNGRIGMTGGSYCGLTQFTAAWRQPPGLVTIAPRVIGDDHFRETVMVEGIPALGVMAGWAFGMAGRAGQNTSLVDWPRIHRHLPLESMAEAAGYRLPHFREWLSHPTHDAFWRAQSVACHLERIALPVLQMSGWYDLYAPGQMRTFARLLRQGQAPQKLIMGPWVHGLNNRVVGQVDFGADATIPLEQIEARWMARWLRDEANGIDREAPLRLFVMGRNAWQDEWEWPPARAHEQAWYLASGGRANSRFGDGRLSRTPPAHDHADSYAYNPEHPVPTMGGRLLGPNAGPMDHAPVERRDDVLVYTTPPQDTPLEIIGEVTLCLHAATDGPDTDFIARLCLLHPDGRAINLCDGVVRLRYREGLEREVPATPGQVYELSISLGPIAQVVQPGQALRLQVTSSCFPRLARNLNTGESVASGTTMRVAHQSVWHGPAHPSRLLLPIVPNP